MRQRHCWYACDSCAEESPQATSFTEARKLAKADGWWIQSGPNGAHFCTYCHTGRAS